MCGYTDNKAGQRRSSAKVTKRQKIIIQYKSQGSVQETEKSNI